MIFQLLKFYVNLIIFIGLCPVSLINPKKYYYPAYPEKAEYPKLSYSSWPMPMVQKQIWQPYQRQQVQQYQRQPELNDQYYNFQMSNSYPKVYINNRNRNDEENLKNNTLKEQEMNETTTKKPTPPPVGGFSLLFGGKPVDPDAEPEEGEEEDEPNPFNFEETSLTLVPAAKYKVRKFPDWCGANVQFSYPITFAFEKLDWPESEQSIGQRIFHLPLFHRRKYDLRRKRSGLILELPPKNTLRGGERTYLLPIIEKVFKAKFGIMKSKVKACIQKTICEIHENQVHQNYGFLGEFLTLIFSISRSSYSETHLPGYLQAENDGRDGNCSAYINKCSFSLFDDDMSNNPARENQCDSDNMDNCQFEATEDE